MRKCARCNDFLDGHTCHTCALRHRCENEKCECQRFPNLPMCMGSDFTASYNKWGHRTDYVHRYAVNSRDNDFRSKRQYPSRHIPKKKKAGIILNDLERMKRI